MGIYRLRHAVSLPLRQVFFFRNCHSAVCHGVANRRLLRPIRDVHPVSPNRSINLDKTRVVTISAVITRLGCRRGNSVLQDNHPQSNGDSCQDSFTVSVHVTLPCDFSEMWPSQVMSNVRNTIANTDFILGRAVIGMHQHSSQGAESVHVGIFRDSLG